MYCWNCSNLHHKGGKRSQQCPRLKLVELQEKARSMGFVMKSGIERMYT